jgi:Tfp pilus assembly protein PilX
MSTVRTNKRNSSEQGIALVMAMLTLLIISTVVAGMMIMSTTDTQIGANFRDEQIAFFAARAGVEEVRDRLRTAAPGTVSTNAWFTTNPPLKPGANSGILYITNAQAGETVTPWVTSADPQWGTGTPHYPDDEVCKEVFTACVNNPPVPTGNPWYASITANNSYAAAPALPWKWVRIMRKINKSDTGATRITSVDGNQSNNFVCWNGSNEVVSATADCGANASVYTITGLAVTSTGTRRMVEYEVTTNVTVPVTAAMYAQNHIDTGQALNVTGNTDSVCSAPSVYGAASGTNTVTTPGSGNVSGSPAGTVNSYGWNSNMIPNLISSLSPGATNVTSAPGISSDSSTPPNYSLTNGTLGTAPTVTYSGSDNITAITSPGTPVTYITPDLTITPVTSPPTYRTITLGGASPGISGQGVLIVRGNLTMDFGQAWSYFGLIIVQGNLTMINTGGGNANPKIHGAILAGGTILANGTGMGNFNGSISIHQNACMVNNAITGQYYKTVAQRELIYQ